MKNKDIVQRNFAILAIFCMVCLVGEPAETGGKTGTLPGDPGINPLNATYTIEGGSVLLIDGRSEVAAAPGSATKVRTAVKDKPVYGDLNGDGDEDAALILVHDPGGSGTFYYGAAAIKVLNRYQGTNAILLGDRVVLQQIEVRDAAVVIRYADRRPEEPMSAEPTVDKTVYLVLKNGKLRVAMPRMEEASVFKGRVIIGHEVRSFRPCNREETLWLAGESPALKEIKAAYRRAVHDAEPYGPVFMILAGKIVEPPVDGFGAAYEAAFRATRLVEVLPGGTVAGDLRVMAHSFLYSYPKTGVSCADKSTDSIFYTHGHCRRYPDLHATLDCARWRGSS